MATRRTIKGVEVEVEPVRPLHRYAIVDRTGAVVNVTMWDGVRRWAPPTGHVAIRDDDGAAEPGGAWDGKAFAPPPPPPPSERDPLDVKIEELERRLATLEAKTANEDAARAAGR